MNELNPNSNRARIADLSLSLYFDGACTRRQVVRQSKRDSSEVKVRNQSNVFSSHVVRLAVTVNQTNHDGGRRFALCELKVCYKNDNPRISINSKIE